MLLPYLDSRRFLRESALCKEVSKGSFYFTGKVFITPYTTIIILKLDDDVRLYVQMFALHNFGYSALNFELGTNLATEKRERVTFPELTRRLYFQTGGL